MIRIGLVMFGLGFGLVVALMGLRLMGYAASADSITGLLHRATCQEAEGNWRNIYVSTVIDTSDPCADFPWPAAPGGEFYNHIRFNNYGLHDTMLTMEKPDGVYRVMIIGDSFPEGIQVPMEEGFPYLLETSLNQHAATNIEVINLGKATFGTDRELLTYASLGWRFEPDLVILSVFMGNDIINNEINLEHLLQGYRSNRPYFTLNDAGSLQMHNSGIPLDPNIFPDAPAYQWLISMQASQAPLSEADLSADEVDLPEWNDAFPVGAGLYMPEDEYWSHSWAITQALITEMRDVVYDDGVHFGVLVIPDGHAVHPDFWQALVTKVPPLAESDPLVPHRKMVDLLQMNGIRMLDLLPAFQNALESGSQTYFYYPIDGHFSPEGHRITAAAMTDWLLNSGLIPR